MLSQTTFGPTDAEIDRVVAIGFPAWLEEQFAKPQALHRDYIDRRTAEIAPLGFAAVQNDFLETFFAQAVAGEDQLRQRMAFALSQIFVVSLADNTLGEMPRGVAAYLDMLGQHAFGNFRDLLEAVSLHPVMGIYLSSLRNQKESATRVPDQNYAREVMQLFSIGLYELNPDGTRRTDSSGNPIETYGSADIAGLSRVFTGWSWFAGPAPGDRTRDRFFGISAHADRDWQPMQSYSGDMADADFHSTSEKRFLGVVIAEQQAADPEASLGKALDTLFDHPNVGPFIGKQLIQRLVTSNPSPAYVGRVAAAFAGNASGVRGDLRSVLRAILLDPEARAAPPVDGAFGKLREPVLRLTNFLRAFDARSISSRFNGIDNTDDPATGLGQTALRAPSVFNFFRPFYAPPRTSIADAGLVAPEMQIVHEISVAGYLNYMRNWIARDDHPDLRLSYSAEIALAPDAGSLVDRMALLLMTGPMSPSLRNILVASVEDRAIPAAVLDAAGNVVNASDRDAAARDRVRIAIYLTMASPEYLVQR